MSPPYSPSCIHCWNWVLFICIAAIKDQLLCVLFEISIHKFGSTVIKSPNAMRWSANIHPISERWKNMRKNCLEISPDSPNVLLGQGSL